MGFSQRLFPKFFATRHPIVPQDNLAHTSELSQQNYSFDRLGELGEQMGERIGLLSARFDEVLTLREDFAEIIKPLDDFVVAHSKAQKRLAEQEALLSQQINTTKSLRRELTDLQTSTASSESELSGTRHKINLLQQQSTLDTEMINRMKIEAQENASRLIYLERQIAAELEKSAALHDACRTKDAELIETDRQANASRGRIAELQDTLAASTAETERLQTIVEQIQPELTRSKQRIVELETGLHVAELNTHTFEAKISQEQKERELLQTKHAQDRAELEAALGAMALQLDGINSRHATTLRHLEQSRSSANDRGDAAQRWERSCKEADAARTTAERRLAIAEEQIRMLSEQSRSLEHSISESKSHCEMLTKAVAAKDAQVAQLQTKATHLESRYATLAQELEREQLQSEAAKRRLMEELESEKAERALAQGALAIARTSREKMAAQVESLRRRRSFQDQSPMSCDSGNAADADVKETNVHHFRSTDAQGA
jgi:crescentin